MFYGSSSTCQLCLSSKNWSKSFLACPFWHRASSLAGSYNSRRCAWVYRHFILSIMDTGIFGTRADVISIQDLSVIASNSLRTNWQTSFASSSVLHWKTKHWNTSLLTCSWPIFRAMFGPPNPSSYCTTSAMVWRGCRCSISLVLLFWTCIPCRETVKKTWSFSPTVMGMSPAI